MRTRMPSSQRVVPDDARRCDLGDDVIVVGILRARWQPLVVGERPDVDLVIVAECAPRESTLTPSCPRCQRAARAHGAPPRLLDSLLRECWLFGRHVRVCGRREIASADCVSAVGSGGSVGSGGDEDDDDEVEEEAQDEEAEDEDEEGGEEEEDVWDPDRLPDTYTAAQAHLLPVRRLSF